MKKSLLITLDFPPNVGGVSVYYKNICENFPKDSIRVLAPNIDYHESFDQHALYKIYRERMISQSLFLWPKWLPMLKQAEKIISSEKIEKILVGNILPCGSAAYIIHKKTKIPYYVFIHGMDLSTLRGKKKILAKKILASADKIITNSNFTRHVVESFGISTDKIITAYPCPNPMAGPNELDIIKMRNAHNFHDKKILLTVGRLVERKGHDMVLQSLPNIIKKYENLVYVIAGNGPSLENLKSMVRNLGLEKNVEFITSANNNDISILYELCDIFIMASRRLANNDYEGFGIVYLEANSFFKPVIAGKSGGVTEAVQDKINGLLVDPENQDEISFAILHLLDNPHYAHVLGMQGMDLVKRNFQWWEQAQKIKNILA